VAEKALLIRGWGLIVKAKAVNVPEKLDKMSSMKDF